MPNIVVIPNEKQVNSAKSYFQHLHIYFMLFYFIEYNLQWVKQIRSNLYLEPYFDFIITYNSTYVHFIHLYFFL